MKNILKILTIILGAFLALILTRMGISYLFVLVALGLILPFLTKDKISAILSGVIYATISYVLSYPAGLFLIDYMPTIDIPINVSIIETIINLTIGLLIPVIISIIICFIASIIGEYLSNRIDKEEKTEDDYHFETENTIEDNYEEDKPIKSRTQRDLINLSPIQKAKNKRKQNKEQELK